MKNNKRTIYFILTLFFCVGFPVSLGFRYSQQIKNMLPAVLVQTFDSGKPAASTSLRNSNPEILTNWSDIQTALNQDHEFVDASAGLQSGKHEVIVFQEEASAGASSTNEGHLQVINGGSQPEMAFTSEDGDELQFTKDGDLFSSDGLVVTLASTFNGSLTLGAGDDLLLSTTSDITISGNTFTVAGATGNTVVGGTLTVTGIATLGDSSQMATSAAPTTDADLANKKYVDDQITAQVPVASRLKAMSAVSSGGVEQQSFNITSTARDSAGVYTITWDTDFAGTDYVVLASINQSAAGFASVTDKTTGTCEIKTFSTAGAGSDRAFSVIAYGTQ